MKLLFSAKATENINKKQERFKSTLSPAAKHKGALILACAIVLAGIINLILNLTATQNTRIAVLREDSYLFLDSSLTIASEQLRQNDLIGVLYNHSDEIAYIRLASQDMPVIEGYIPSGKLSFDFDRANQALITSDNIYDKPDENRLLADISAKGLICNVIEYSKNSDMVMIIRPGDTERLWVKSSDMSYDINFDIYEASAGGHYREVKEYLQEKYTQAYKPYYDTTLVEQLSGYKESIDEKNKTLTAEFTMNAKFRNYYKDPDTVEYIKDAKRIAESSDDEYYRKLYNTYYNEYNSVKDANYTLKLTAKLKRGKIDTDSVMLYSGDGVKGTDWHKLENGFNDFIME
ncbi:MAG: hypothetical protein J6C82_03125 [Clostridia bacterium]|nr:hypothetical protein [Clostridia bacterium]